MKLSNRKIVEEILPTTFARVIYQGPEGVIASAPGASTAARLGGSGYIYDYAVSGKSSLRINEDTPATVYLPFTADPEYSFVQLGHSDTCGDSGDKFQDLVTAACLSSPGAALHLLNHGGLYTENYPQEAYEDPAFCKAAVELYTPRIRYVPEKNLTPELYLSAIVGNTELYHDINDGHIPLAPLAKAEFAKAVFARELSGDVINTLKRAFDRQASLFVEAAKDEAWLRAVPAELHGWSPAVKALVSKLD